MQNPVSCTILYYKSLAEKGQVEGMFNYAKMLYGGIGAEIDKKTGAYYFKKAADLGHLESMHRYGLMCLNGDGIAANQEEAENYLKKAAVEQFPSALISYGIFLRDVVGTKKAKNDALSYFKMASDLNEKNAKNLYEKLLSDINNEIYDYEDDDDDDDDSDDSDDSDNENTDNDDDDESEKPVDPELDKIYHQGLDYKSTDIKKAEQYIKEAADKGHINAIVEYSTMLYCGYGIQKNVKEAIHYIKKAADLGVIDCIRWYADLCYIGEETDQDNEESARYYKKGADMKDETCAYYYAKLLSNGEIANADKKEAAKYYKKAAEGREKMAYFPYAEILFVGELLPENKKKAAKYFKKAADNGNVLSMKCYAILALNGIGIDVNIDDHNKYLIKAAKKEDPEACESYASCLFCGKNVTQNYMKAAKYFKIAADGGRNTAMVHYANMLFQGIGIQQDQEEALRYYKMAADTGDKDAIACYQKILEITKQKQTKEVQSLPSQTNNTEETSMKSKPSLISIDSIIEKPKINAIIKEEINKDFICFDAGFENGIFGKIRSKFHMPATLAGFVVILADTKKFMPLTIHNLVDGKKQSDWYSTKMDHPSISLYFPYHLIELKAIGFRSHFDKHFGDHFLRIFTIYGICDDKTITCIGSFNTEKLCDFKEEVIFKVNSPSKLRAIKIVSDSGKFGLNSLEIFGYSIYNEITESFTHDFLNNQSIYNRIKSTDMFIDTDNPRNRIGRKIKNKFKKKEDPIKEWDDISDNEDFDETKANDLERKCIIDNHESTFIFDSYESGTSIIQKLEDEYNFYEHLEFTNNYPMLSFKRQYIKKPETEFQFWFKSIKIQLRGIKIKTCSNPKYLPKSLVVIGNKQLDNSHFDYLLYDIEVKLQPCTEYYFPVNKCDEFYNMIALVSKDNEPFTLEHVDFYGKTFVNNDSNKYSFSEPPSLNSVKISFPLDTVSEKKTDNRNEPGKFGLMAKNSYPNITDSLATYSKEENKSSSNKIDFLSDKMTEITIDDINGPGIFETMTKYYGPDLNDLLVIYSHSKKDENRSRIGYKEKELSSNNLYFPSLYFFLKNCELKLTHVKITASEKGTNLENFYFKYKKLIFGKYSYKFKPGESHVFKMEKVYTLDCFNLYGLNGPFSIKKIDVYGKLTKIDQRYSDIPPKWRDLTAEYLLRDHYELIFKESNEKNDKLAKDQKILFSARDYKNPSNDIISIGKTRFSDFVSFYSYQNDDDSILNHDEKNVWKSLTNYNGVSGFEISFKHHSARLSAISLYIPKLSGADKSHYEYPFVFELYGYNPLTNFWELILKNEEEFEPETNYVLYTTTKSFYQTIKFVHYDGDFVLSYISLFGDVKEEKNTDPSTFMVGFKNHPPLSWKILSLGAIEYGHYLENFCQITITPYVSNYNTFNLYDGLKVKNGQSFYCFNNDCDTVVKFFFDNHAIYLDSYSITSSDCLNPSDSWVVTGISYHGKLISIDKRTIKYKDYYQEYVFDISKEAKQTPLRLIKFKFGRKITAFNKIDFQGCALPLP